MLRFFLKNRYSKKNRKRDSVGQFIKTVLKQLNFLLNFIKT